MSEPGDYSLAADKERLLTQIKATFDFLPNTPTEAEKIEPWLFWQLTEFLKSLRRRDLALPVLMALVGVLGPSFAATLPPIIGDGTTEEEGIIPVLRAV